MNVVLAEHISPDLGICALQEISCLSPEHRVFIGDVDQLQVVLTLLIRDDCQVRIALLAVLADTQGVVLIVLLEESFRTGIGVYDD